jgi:hypothetical protein
METKTVVEANLDSYTFGCFEEDFNFTEIDMSNIEEYAEKLGCSKELLELMLDNFTMLTEYLIDDLTDMWRKLENK